MNDDETIITGGEANPSEEISPRSATNTTVLQATMREGSFEAFAEQDQPPHSGKSHQDAGSGNSRRNAGSGDAARRATSGRNDDTVGTAAQPRKQAARPEAFGPYQVESVLGEGGMGVVYRGVHTQTGQSVAIKTLHSVSSTALSGLRREIHALGKVAHPRIVSIVDHRLSDAVPWYAMELLQGLSLRDAMHEVWCNDDGSLRDVIDDERVNSLLVLLADLCAPLAHLHTAGLVHRDLKPSNVVLNQDGRPVLVDLGLSLSFAGDANREALLIDGAVAGTPSYMAPEQIRGQLLDARTDLYALGCMLFECLTGRPPFSATTLNNMLSQHIGQPPAAPSQKRPGVPAALDALALKLLQKKPADRIGYADDVARTIHEVLGHDAATPRSARANPSYLYRAELCGRTPLIAQLRKRLLALPHTRRPPLVLISGESGSGKTRLILELALQAAQRDIELASGQSETLGSAASPQLGAPLLPLRPLLTAAADRQRQCDPHMQQLLQTHGPVLAAYSEDIAQLPAVAQAPPAAALPHDAARARLFTSLSAVAAALAEHRPLWVVLDDLQWADGLTLAWLAHLAEKGLPAEGRLALLGTFRSEEAPQTLAQLAQQPNVTCMQLDRLDARGVEAMAAGMLAMRRIPKAVTSALMHSSDGNPFFVAEYLRAAIAAGALQRDERGRWQFQPQHDLQALPLPSRLALLIEQRLSHLSAAAEQLLASAAVLGRSMATELLNRTAQLADTAALDAFDELRRRHILELHQGQLRFVHDKLRESSYARTTPARRRTLHHHAAEVLQQLSPGREAEPRLAFHYARAGMPAPAYRHYLNAAAHARDAYDNEQAIARRRSAIDQGLIIEELSAVEPSVEEPSAEEPDLSTPSPSLYTAYQRLGQRLTAAGRQNEARDAYQRAVTLLPESEHLQHAELQQHIGKCWELVQAHNQALAAYDRTEQHLDAAPAEASGARPAAWWHRWIGLQIERISIHYFRADSQALQQTMARLQPELERHGTEQQRARFYQSLGQRNMRTARYLVDRETVAHVRASLAGFERIGNELETATARFGLAFALCCHNALDEAEEQIDAALRDAERLGHLPLQARCIAYATMILRRRRNIDTTRVYALRCRTLAERNGMRDYIGVATANLGWIAWCNGRAQQALEQCEQALQQWQQLKVAYPFQWMARMPLLAIALASEQPDAAHLHAKAILQPEQQRLPADLTAAIQELTRSPSPSLTGSRWLSNARTHGFL